MTEVDFVVHFEMLTAVADAVVTVFAVVKAADAVLVLLPGLDSGNEG